MSKATSMEILNTSKKGQWPNDVVHKHNSSERPIVGEKKVLEISQTSPIGRVVALECHIPQYIRAINLVHHHIISCRLFCTIQKITRTLQRVSKIETREVHSRQVEECFLDPAR